MTSFIQCKFHFSLKCITYKAEEWNSTFPQQGSCSPQPKSLTALQSQGARHTTFPSKITVCVN